MSELQKGKVNGGSHTLDHVPTVDCAIRRSRTTAHARGLRERRGPPSPRTVPAPPQKRQPRTGDDTARFHRTSQERPAGSHRVAGARHQVDSSPIGGRRRVPRSYWRDPLRHLPGHVAKYGPVILELFSGSGRWAAAWRSAPPQARRYDCFEFDIRWHLKNDLLSPKVARI